MHSTTKYLGGHSDVVGGVVVTRSEEWYERLRFIQNSVGAVPGPFDCFLVHRGIRTLAVRMAAHARSAEAVVEMLRGCEQVSDVRWPGFSGMVSFRHPDALGIVARTRLFTLAESLGGVESLIEVPQAMTHQSVEGSDAAVPPTWCASRAASRTRPTSRSTCARRSAARRASGRTDARPAATERVALLPGRRGAAAPRCAARRPVQSRGT